MAELGVTIHRALPWALGAGVFATSFVTPLQSPMEVAAGNLSPWIPHAFGVISIAALSGIAAGLVFWRRWPLYVMAVVGWVVYSMWPTPMVASFFAALEPKERWKAGAYLTVSSLLVVVPIAMGTVDPTYGVRFGAIMLPLTILMPYAAGLWVRTRRQLIAELQTRNERLESEQAARAAQARAEERARIAREMHDVVAHRVAMIVLHAGGLEVHAPDERTAVEAGLIRTTGREALNELRQVLGVLREPGGGPQPQPLLANLDQLVEQTNRAGAVVDLRVEGEPVALPAQVERSVYRFVQEALTNVVKHAPGSHAAVLVRTSTDQLEVIVQNGPAVGDKAAQPLPSSGLGLIGLRERIELLGGTFEATRMPTGGFRVKARLPLTAIDHAA